MRTSQTTLPTIFHALSRQRRPLGLMLAWMALTLAIHHSAVGSLLERRLAVPIAWQARAALGKSPHLSPRLKILGYDDNAVQFAKEPEINLEDWAALIDSIAAKKPKVIVIDKMFGLIPAAERAHVPKFQQALADAKVVVSGAFATLTPILSRPQLDSSRSDYKLSSFIEAGMDADAEAPSWLNRPFVTVYGPSSEVATGFAHVGHFLYPEGGRVAPFVRVGPDTAVPHMTFFTAESIAVDSHGPILSGRHVPLDADGMLHVNFSQPSEYFGATYGLAGSLVAARNRKPLSTIEEGDYVLILPLLYTGNHDVVETPTGRLPGGFVLAAIINSIIKDDWIKPMAMAPVLAVFWGMAAFCLALFGSTRWFWLSQPVVMFLAGLCGLAGFVYWSIHTPWLVGVISAFGCGMIAYVTRAAAGLREAQKMRSALRGVVPQKTLDGILKGDSRLEREPTERVVTVLFLDIANFSAVAERVSPRDAFMTLKDVLRDVTKTIHKYGGTVDKTLGDGLLAFFGYSFDGSTVEGQADQALRCSIEIQRDNLQGCANKAALGLPVMPFRIGLNTGAVYVGDLGNEDRLDLTIIGNGVNFAKRLESACEHHLVMASATTLNFAQGMTPKSAGVVPRGINIKHHDELFEAYEIDPFVDAKEDHRAALQAIRNAEKAERREQRWPVGDGLGINIQCDVGKATIVDFSPRGLCLRLDRFLSKGVTIVLSLSVEDPQLRALLEANGLMELKAEVRWGRPADGQFIHGVLFANLGDAQRLHLFDLLRARVAHVQRADERLSSSLRP